MANSVKPSFGDKQIIRILQELNTGISIALTDFQKPTGAFVCNIYPSLLSFLDLNIGSISDFPAFQNLPYPEIHRGMMQTCLLAKHLQSFFNQINCAVQFQLSDLINPVPIRCRFFISEMLNFILFTKENYESLHKVRESRQESAVRLEALQATKDELTNQYTNEVAEVAARADKVKNFEAHVAACGNKKRQLKEEIIHQETYMSEVKSEISELEERIAVRERTRLDKQAFLRTMENQLVSSPDRIRGEFQHLQESEAAMDSQVKEREAVLHVRKNLQHCLESYMNSANEIKKRADQTAKLLTTRKSIETESEKLKAQEKQVLVQLQQEEMLLCTANSNVSKTIEEVGALKLGTQKRMLSMTENHLEFLKEREHLEDLLDATEQRVSELEEEKKDFRKDEKVFDQFKKKNSQTCQGAQKHMVDQVKENYINLLCEVNKSK
ncbi:hypothetical protein B566_EDAN012450 [Ephemera danica]|nr:hypothetical protein B566_EDAN012450 [Ephemera danica]